MYVSQRSHICKLKRGQEHTPRVLFSQPFSRCKSDPTPIPKYLVQKKHACSSDRVIDCACRKVTSRDAQGKIVRPFFYAPYVLTRRATFLPSLPLPVTLGVPYNSRPQRCGTTMADTPPLNLPRSLPSSPTPAFHFSPREMVTTVTTEIYSSCLPQ